jgi:hypothetical protein
LISSGSLHPARAQGVNSLPGGPVVCEAFQGSGHGSWTVLRPATYTPWGSVEPCSRATFAPNQMFQGFEATAILDRSCGN